MSARIGAGLSYCGDYWNIEMSRDGPYDAAIGVEAPTIRRSGGYQRLKVRMSGREDRTSHLRQGVRSLMRPAHVPVSCAAQ